MKEGRHDHEADGKGTQPLSGHPTSGAPSLGQKGAGAGKCAADARVKGRRGRGQGAHVAPPALGWSAFLPAHVIFCYTQVLGLPVGRPKDGQPAEVAPHDAEIRPLIMARDLGAVMG